MSEFRTKCPHCNSEWIAEEEWNGMEAECPGCKKIFTVAKTYFHPVKSTLTIPHPAITTVHSPAETPLSAKVPSVKQVSASPEIDKALSSAKIAKIILWIGIAIVLILLPILCLYLNLIRASAEDKAFQKRKDEREDLIRASAEDKAFQKRKDEREEMNCGTLMIDLKCRLHENLRKNGSLTLNGYDGDPCEFMNLTINKDCWFVRGNPSIHKIEDCPEGSVVYYCKKHTNHKIIKGEHWYILYHSIK